MASSHIHPSRLSSALIPIPPFTYAHTNHNAAGKNTRRSEDSTVHRISNFLVGPKQQQVLTTHDSAWNEQLNNLLKRSTYDSVDS